jgi:hypothetical protein
MGSDNKTTKTKELASRWPSVAFVVVPGSRGHGTQEVPFRPPPVCTLQSAFNSDEAGILRNHVRIAAGVLLSASTLTAREPTFSPFGFKVQPEIMVGDKSPPPP